MPSTFPLNIPIGAGAKLSLSLNTGSVLYMLGANGTGKSSLVSNLFNAHQGNAKRISAHRQTWFESNTLDLTPLSREHLRDSFRSQDIQTHARYRDWNASARSNAAIFDLIDSDTMQARRIAAYVRANDDAAAKKEAQNPSPIQVINELMRLSNLPIEISVEEGQKIVARKRGGVAYSVAELSDGERNAFLIASEILTAKPGTLILVDEPERHLHRSIISPLLRLLFDRRKDCAFIVSTHEIMLPMDTPDASTLLLRSCEYKGQSVESWTADIVPPGSSIDDGLKLDLLGARRKMLFVEGAVRSLDTPLYSLLFPEVSVIAKESCRDVEYAVKGLRGASGMHWIAAFGVVDNDQRTRDDIARLHDAGVWALPYYSVEALYYHPDIVARIAKRQAHVTGTDPVAAFKAAIEGAIQGVKDAREHLVTGALLRSTRERILGNLPKRRETLTGTLRVEVDLSTLRLDEEARFDGLVAASNWEGVLTRYPVRESTALDRIVSGVGIRDKESYRGAVLKLLQDDQQAVDALRSLLGDLYAAVSA